MQGTLGGMSIGFEIPKNKSEVIEGGIRVIREVKLWEVSLVTFPAQPKATIESVKSADTTADLEEKKAIPFQNLPIAGTGKKWDVDKAVDRVRAITNSKDAPSTTYRKAFLWFDSENAELFTSYRFQIADVVDNELRAVPHAIFEIADLMSGTKGGVDLPQQDLNAIRRHLSQYYAKMDLVPPWEEQLTADPALVLSFREAAPDFQALLNEFRTGRALAAKDSDPASLAELINRISKAANLTR
jgi:hypothetical protein